MEQEVQGLEVHHPALAGMAMLTSSENLVKLILPGSWAGPSQPSGCVWGQAVAFSGPLGGAGQVLRLLGSLQVTVVRERMASALVGAQSTFQLLGHQRTWVRG